MDLKVHLVSRGSDGKPEVRGVVSLRNGRVEFGEGAEEYLVDHMTVLSPVEIGKPLTPEDAVAYMLALPYNLRGSYCWAEIPGVDLQKTSPQQLFERHGVGADAASRSTAARYRPGPAARVCDTPPPDDEPLGCGHCGWTGVVHEAPAEYFRDCWHRECPRCEKMLLVLPYARPPLLKPEGTGVAPVKAQVRIRFKDGYIELAGIPGPNGEPPADVGNVGDDPDAIYLSRRRRRPHRREGEGRDGSF